VPTYGTGMRKISVSLSIKECTPSRWALHHATSGGSVEAMMQGQFKPTLETVVAESDKMILQPGETAETRLSATLLDDSFIAIEETQVVYKSSNPSVVNVDKNGTVTALQPGVASIFAYVTYSGTTASDSYPVKVVPDLTPLSISVNRKPLPTFNPEVKAYSFLMKEQSTIPGSGSSSSQ
jgi:beta-glucosidase